MSTRLVLLATLLFSSTALSVLVVTTPWRSSPLLLPVAHAGTPVEFFDVEFPQGAYVWCLDRSCSMAWANSPIATMQAEVIESIMEFPSSGEFSLVSYGSTTETWSDTLQPIDPDTFASASDWVNDLDPSGWQCMEEALLTSLEIAEQSTQSVRAVFLLFHGDVPFCNGDDIRNEVLDNVTAANTEGISIHVVYLSDFQVGAQFCQGLADMNDGVAVLTQGASPPVFTRGDLDADGTVQLPDGLFLLGYQFLSGPTPTCLDAADVDDNGVVDGLVDALFLLNFVFAGGAMPPFPGPTDCGIDPDGDGDDIACASAPACP